jgi:hypothetical protein
MISSGAASGPQIAVLAALSASTLLSFLGDSYTTMVGLQHGLTEGNPISRWLFKKIGQAGTYFAEAVALLFAIATISNYDLNAAYLFAGIVTAGEAVMVVRNYRLLKARKISLK